MEKRSRGCALIPLRLVKSHFSVRHSSTADSWAGGHVQSLLLPSSCWPRRPRISQKDSASTRRAQLQCHRPSRRPPPPRPRPSSRSWFSTARATPRSRSAPHPNPSANVATLPISRLPRSDALQIPAGKLLKGPRTASARHVENSCRCRHQGQESPPHPSSPPPSRQGQPPLHRGLRHQLTH